MKVPLNVFADVVIEETAKSGKSKKVAKEIAAYLLEEGRTGELHSLLRTIQEKKAERGFVEVSAVSAFPINEPEQKFIKSVAHDIYPKTHTVVIDHAIQPEIIGGLIVNTPSSQLDLSIQSKLTKFKQLTTAGKE